jgi:serine kinase of HPr protein (carbohydrate metabolism regulator)
MTLAHGTCVELDGAAVLLRGAPGSGKSDLALRLIDAGAHLVADDQVLLQPRHGMVFAAAPAAIAGRMEVRGLGIVAQRCVAEARLALVVDLVAPEAVERLPEPGSVDLVGVVLPAIKLAPFEASAVAKLRLALQRSGARLKAVG